MWLLQIVVHSKLHWAYFSGIPSSGWESVHRFTTWNRWDTHTNI